METGLRNTCIIDVAVYIRPRVLYRGGGLVVVDIVLVILIL